MKDELRRGTSVSEFLVQIENYVFRLGIEPGTSGSPSRCLNYETNTTHACKTPRPMYMPAAALAIAPYSRASLSLIAREAGW